MKSWRIGKGPAAAGLRELEHRAGQVRAVAISGATEISAGIEGQVVVWAGDAAEAVERGQRPVAAGGRQLVDRPAAIDPAKGRSAVEIAGVIEDHATRGSAAVIGVLEVVEDGFRPAGTGGRQLEDRAPSVGAAAVGGAVQISGAVERQACDRIGAIATPGKVIDDALRPVLPGTHRFENGSHSSGATEVRCAIHVASRIEDHAAERLETVVAGAELMNRVVRPGADDTGASCGMWPHVEDGAGLVKCAGRSRAVGSAIGAESHRSVLRQGPVACTGKAVQGAQYPG